MIFHSQSALPVTLIAALTVLALGCGGNPERIAQKVDIVQGLHVQKIHSQIVPDELEAPGTVIAISTAQVSPRIMGTVLQVAVREGDSVKRGQLLALLDERELSARRNAAQAASQSAAAGVTQATKAVAAAQAQADIAQKTYHRYSLLKQQNSVSPQEFDEVSARQQAAQAALAQAQAALQQAQAAASQADSESHAAQDVASYARVTAPFDGRVLRRSVDPGSLVLPGVPLFIIEDTSRYQLQATLPAESVAIVRTNSLARVQLDGLDAKSFSAKVAEIEAGVDPSSHTLNARVDLPRDPTIRSGLFGRAFFPRGERQAYLVPSSALVNRGQLTGIYIVDNDALIHWRVITLGRKLGEQIEVLSGLNDGDAVVSAPGPQELDGKKAASQAASTETRP
jgi:membrane fusion protein, multidrug efflux system